MPDRHHEFKVLVMQRDVENWKAEPLPAHLRHGWVWESLGALIAISCFAGFGFLLLWIAGLI